MKHMKRRGLAAGLSLLLAVSPMAAASEALGHELHTGRGTLSQGTGITTQIFWSDTYSDLRTEHYFTYTPNDSVTPAVSYGDKVLSRATLTAMAQALEGRGERVVAGINGDYYVMATGTPVGLVITDGVIRSASPFNYAIGFRSDGTAFIGEPKLSVTASFLGRTHPVNGSINKVRGSERGYYLLTEDFHATTQNSAPGVDVILTPVPGDWVEPAPPEPTPTPVPESTPVPPQPTPAPGETDSAAQAAGDTGESGPGMEPEETGPGAMPDPAPAPAAAGLTAAQSAAASGLIYSNQLVVNGRVTCTVDQVLESTGSISIPAGKLVLTINAGSDAALVEAARALSPGDRVDLSVTSPDSRWAEAEEALGGLYQLISNGAVCAAPAGSTGAWGERTARTAVGIKADGTVIFYTIDGKQSGYSVGATLTQAAMRLAELGCVEAICMDGGGSTTAGATYPDGSVLGVINKPQDGAQRANSTAIFLTTTLKPTGELGSLQLKPNDAMVLAGSTVQMAVTGVDTHYYHMDYSGPVTYSVQNGDGLVTLDGLFTAGSESGVTQVAATAGGAMGAADITVVKTPSQISAVNQATGAAITALAVQPGERVDLKAVATYRTLPLTCTDTAFTWTVDPAVGAVDENGVFTAGEESASGTLTVSAGGAALAIPVNVASHVIALETFEGSFSSITSTAAATASAETRPDYVRYGRQSVRVDYDTAAGGTAGLVSTLAIPAGESWLGLWVYGDGSGNLLTATVADQAGTAADVLLATLDFTGWKHINAALPKEASAIRSLQVIYGGVEEHTAGTLWLDHLTTSNEAITDTTPPTVTLTLADGQIKASVSDGVDRTISKESVVLTRDGVPVTAVWDEASGTLTAALPAADSQTHRFTVTAVDASGNLARASADQAPVQAREPVFTDTEGHWAAVYADYLYDTGVTNGVIVEDGLEFRPGRNITRGEFFALTARWMGLDLAAYAGVELPFADAAQIPDWCLNEVKAMYSLGILQGVKSGETITCSAGATISRAEAMTILGRTQARGYAETPLVFADAGQVPLWSLPYVRALVSQGVAGGYNNQIQPLSPITRGEVAKMLYAML